MRASRVLHVSGSPVETAVLGEGGEGGGAVTPLEFQGRASGRGSDLGCRVWV